MVTSSSAKIGWVTTKPENNSVIITKPDGTAVATVTGEVQSTQLANAGDKQMWAKVENLEPATIYCYKIDNAVEPTGFRTAPASDSDAPVRVLAFGDSGGGGTDQRVLRDRMYDYPYDLMIHTGDVAYEGGSEQQIEDTVFAVYKDLFKNIPFFPVAGNHDEKTADGQPLRDAFELPNNERWFSFDYGQVHFAAIDTEADYDTQIRWLQQDLADSKAPWKIVYSHHPPYSSGAEHGSDTALRSKLAPVLEATGVQLMLSGHDHDYERMLPQNGTTYVVTGGGGRGTYNVGASDFTAFSDACIHYVLLDVTSTELTVHAIDATGTEFDSVVIPRG
jgi:3',5'-cyclic AMP phosphodiesterase CpdA